LAIPIVPLTEGACTQGLQCPTQGFTGKARSWHRGTGRDWCSYHVQTWW